MGPDTLKQLKQLQAQYQPVSSRTAWSQKGHRKLTAGSGRDSLLCQEGPGVSARRPRGSPETETYLRKRRAGEDLRKTSWVAAWGMDLTPLGRHQRITKARQDSHMCWYMTTPRCR